MEPKSLKIGAGAPPNRSGADSGNCGRGADLRGNAETRPEAKNKKKERKKGFPLGMDGRGRRSSGGRRGGKEG